MIPSANREVSLIVFPAKRRQPTFSEAIILMDFRPE